MRWQNSRSLANATFKRRPAAVFRKIVVRGQLTIYRPSTVITLEVARIFSFKCPASKPCFCGAELAYVLPRGIYSIADFYVAAFTRLQLHLGQWYKKSGSISKSIRHSTEVSTGTERGARMSESLSAISKQILASKLGLFISGDRSGKHRIFQVVYRSQRGILRMKPLSGLISQQEIDLYLVDGDVKLAPRAQEKLADDKVETKRPGMIEDGRPRTLEAGFHDTSSRIRNTLSIHITESRDNLTSPSMTLDQTQRNMNSDEGNVSGNAYDVSFIFHSLCKHVLTARSNAAEIFKQKREPRTMKQLLQGRKLLVPF